MDRVADADRVAFVAKALSDGLSTLAEEGLYSSLARRAIEAMDEYDRLSSSARDTGERARQIMEAYADEFISELIESGRIVVLPSKGAQ